ncbi:hypothetical protein GlitD10_0494 [Gloeomargarita lithophora Alchichica-D10]|uniref:Uncharacterized protein n=1 Tax=Gloeomargarita lithophora Alchichica-D10 TaxID=1188229 RepID=A0A1J0AA50_9CYAN|nr:hypothetical protein [Gloeomargarita lithophora]APB32806.1 hypothetical protein GlitD10_0494 [Gloeomargarita lithophora Alchichica-D10]
MPRKDIYKDAVPFKRQGDIPGDVPLGKSIGIRLPADIDKAIRALPEPTAWARQVLIQAARAELLGECPAVTPGTEPAGDSQAQDNSPAVVAAVNSGAELLQLVDTAQRLKTVPENETAPPPPGNPPVDQASLHFEFVPEQAFVSVDHLQKVLLPLLKTAREQTKIENVQSYLEGMQYILSRSAVPPPPVTIEVQARI